MFYCGSFVLMTALQSRYYYTHFIDEDTKAQRRGSLPKDTQPIHGRAGIPARVTGSQVKNNGCHLRQVSILALLHYLIWPQQQAQR